MMQSRSEEVFKKQKSALEGYPMFTMDILACVNRWNSKPWEGLLKGHLSEYLVPVEARECTPEATT